MSQTVAVVIPCYKVCSHILEVIAKIGAECDRIYVVDDCCPESTGEYVAQNCADARICVLRNEVNMGVGGAVMAGYLKAIEDGATVIVKIDGDGQMDPSLISIFVAPIVCGEADYTKGNRFFDVETVRQMPPLRLLGNAGLSFLTKLSSGYWNLMDPTNGYTAISASVVSRLPLEKIERRFFFESDMLFRLNTLRAVVIDIPMLSKYGEEKSNLNIIEEIPKFLFFNLRNFLKRILYNYFIRDFNFASLELVLGLTLFAFGAIFGISNWVENWKAGTFASSGTVMVAGLCVILGLQLLLGFSNYDTTNIPVITLQSRLHIDARHCQSR